jgi:hypothetical protein
MEKDGNISVYLLVLFTNADNGCTMDLFEKIDQFEKLANELLDQTEVEDMQDAETIEEYTTQGLERQNSAKIRINKLAALLKR